ncbi:pantothenate kinase [Aliterella atlantica]|uniref:Type III pantothenate kinase n=1 Tax=Aliterella atlantica CENA595 TaxID=1618023 RepID=A0A0D8ZYP5_9CYAN|nr:pantothenate kinase [Aliterella atlantica]KJH72326.1 pantothenate kinase [Aliterella atlantica CENA595]
MSALFYVLESNWLTLAIGNSRLHWALFAGESLLKNWDAPHLLASCSNWAELSVNITNGDRPLPLFLASVVPSQTALWQTYPNLQIITLDKVPIKGTYPTLGIDRALALWGAIETYSIPVLVIDAGTALTFTGASNFSLVGGAILPGLSLQFQSLGQKTAGLSIEELPAQLPPRFATNTTQAIQSGIIYTIIASLCDYIQSWLQQYPNSKVVLTGGDRTILLNYLSNYSPQLATKIIVDGNLIFWGVRSYRKLYRASG